MKPHRFAYYAVTGVAVALLAGVFLTTGRGQDATQPEAKDRERQSVIEAMRRGGLREAARIKGRHVVSDRVRGEAIYADLEALASHSDVVVVGTAVQNVCQLTPEGDNITTNYEVRVDQTFKGAVKRGGAVRVGLPGGMVQFEDGTSAEVRVPGFRKMEDGKTYVLFLSEQKNRPGFFEVVGGPQGLFELSADSVTVKSHGRPIDVVASKYKDKDQRAFLKEVRDAAKKWPGPAVCCE